MGCSAADQATPKWDPGARPEPRTVVRQTVSGRRYPIWGRPGLLVWEPKGASSSPRKLVACGSEKELSEKEKNLTQFGHRCKTAARASLRSDNCPTIPDECPTIIGLLSINFGLGVQNHRNAQGRPFIRISNQMMGDLARKQSRITTRTFTRTFCPVRAFSDLCVQIPTKCRDSGVNHRAKSESRHSAKT